MSQGTPRPSARPWRTRIALTALGALGQLPEVGLGGRLLVDVAPAHRRWGVELGLAHLPQRESEVRTGAGGRFSLISLASGMWWTPYRTELTHLRLVASGEVGRITARGFGFEVNSVTRDTWLLNLATYAELSFAVAERWEVLGRAGLATPLIRDSFEVKTVAGSRVVFQPSRVMGVAAFGIGFSP